MSDFESFNFFASFASRDLVPFHVQRGPSYFNLAGGWENVSEQGVGERAGQATVRPHPSFLPRSGGPDLAGAEPRSPLGG